MKSQQYKDLCAEIKACQNCPLWQDMPGTDPVPGVGPVDAKIMLVGEALGEDESFLEEPFVGRCGKLLNNTLLKGAGLTRAECYICNVVNCRPTKKTYSRTSNRPPSELEIDRCKSWLWKQIKLVEPKVIVTMGKIPTFTLLSQQLKKNFTLGKEVGKEFTVSYTSAKIIPNWHPSYILVHGKDKQQQCIDTLAKANSLV